MESIVTSTCAVHFNYRAYEAIEEHINKANYSKVFILVDENTNKHCLPQFSAQLDKVFDFEVIEIESGEAYKNIDTCAQVWDALSELDADRRSLLINLGQNSRLSGDFARWGPGLQYHFLSARNHV